VSKFKRLAVVMALGIITAFTGCGYVTPELQENRADIVAGQQLVDSIAYNIKCEIQDSVDKIYNNPDHRRKSTFLDTWGAQTTLSLQVEEKSTLNPTANWIPPNPATAPIFYSEARWWVMQQGKTNSIPTIPSKRLERSALADLNGRGGYSSCRVI
jgi:hypothetical protein